MTGKIAAALVVIGQASSAIGAFILAQNEIPFGLDAHDVGLALVWISNFATFIVVALRRNLVPGLTSGIGNEPQGVTKTTTLTTETEVTP